MAKLPRVTAKIFALNAAPGDIGQYGSALNGNKLLTGDIAQIQALDAYETGWRAAVLSTRNYPTLQEMNGLQKTFSQQIAYILNNGIAEYDADTTYYIGDFVKVIENNIPLIKYSVIDNNTGNNTSDTNYWRNFQAGEIMSSGVPDVVIIGSPTIQNGQVSGFTTSDYIQYPIIFDPQSYNWEMNLCVTTGAASSITLPIAYIQGALQLSILNGKLVTFLSSSGSSWDIASAQLGTAAISANTTYYIRFSFNGSSYIISISTDNSTYTADITVSSSASIYPGNLLFGNSPAAPFNGSINLNYCNVFINGVEVWTGIDDIGLATKANIDLSNLSAAGEARFKKAGYPIGAPIPQMSANMGLADNEIYLEGATVTQAAYPELYAVYGDTYSTAAVIQAGNFTLPDLRNKVLWGAPGISSDLYTTVQGVLPGLKGTIASLTGDGDASQFVANGVFSVNNLRYLNNVSITGAGMANNLVQLGFDASSYNGVYSSTSTSIVRPTSLYVRWKTRYK